MLRPFFSFDIWSCLLKAFSPLELNKELFSDPSPWFFFFLFLFESYQGLHYILRLSNFYERKEIQILMYPDIPSTPNRTTLTTRGIDCISQVCILPLAKVMLFNASCSFGSLDWRSPKHIQRNKKIQKCSRKKQVRSRMQRGKEESSKKIGAKIGKIHDMLLRHTYLREKEI